jgi:hypothetical protein
MGVNFPDTPTNGQTTTVGNTVYSYNSTVGAWEILSSGGIGTMTTKGDLLSRSSSGLSRIGVGTNNQVLVADSSQTGGMKWGTNPTVTTSSTRSTDIPTPFEGQMIYETDTDRTLVWNNSAWLVLSSPTALTIDENNRVGLPNQPMFYATGATGDYTSGILPYNTTTTNIGSHYNTTTRTFTAPTAGVYLFTTQHWAAPGVAGAIFLTVAGRNCVVGREAAQTGYEGYCGSQVAYMTAGQTATTSVYLGTIHLNSGLSYFSGVLLG